MSGDAVRLDPRVGAPELGFADVLLAGLATDGGLYVPAEWPSCRRRPSSTPPPATPTLAAAHHGAVRRRRDRRATSLAPMCADAYATFRHPAVVPLVQIDDRHWLLELFHGPTLAFKDVALQLVGRLFDHVLGERGERVTIVGATSGDTGSAAIDGVHGCANVDIVILYPDGRAERGAAPADDDGRRAERARRRHRGHVRRLPGPREGDVQRRRRSARDMRLSAVNSINWARVMAQIVYYVTAAARSAGPGHGRACRPATSATCSPAGSPARWARRSSDFIVASNANDILTRFVNDDDMSTAAVVPDAQPEHGHPGVVELRAAAVRDERPRRRA